MSEACDFDGGDCKRTRSPATKQCAPGCEAAWIGDGANVTSNRELDVPDHPPVNPFYRSATVPPSARHAQASATPSAARRSVSAMVATAKDCVRQGARRRGWAITCATTNVTRRRATSTAATATPSTASGRWLRRRCDARGVAQTRGVATGSATLGATSQRATSTVATATASLERNVLACAPELPALACSLAWAALMAYASARTGQ